MTYPTDIYEQRPLENLPGLVYDPENKKTLFAEDILGLGREIEQIEETLGLNLSNIEDLINYIVDGKLESKWPIGTAYINFSDSTNPAELLGFGTWVLDSKGRVLVGKADSGTFSSVGGTVGSESHNHGLAGTGSALIGSPYGNAVALGFASSQVGSLSGSAYSVGGLNHNAAGHPNRSHNTKLDGYTNNGSTIQPSLVVYIWKRTA